MKYLMCPLLNGVALIGALTLALFLNLLCILWTFKRPKHYKWYSWYKVKMDLCEFDLADFFTKFYITFRK